EMLGKLPAKRDPRTLKFRRYLGKQVRKPPRAADFSASVKKLRWPMFANDRLPSCTCAAAGHMVQVWSANVGAERILPDSAIIRTYRRFVGDAHRPNKHMIDVLNYWRRMGIGGDRISAYVQLAPRDPEEVKIAIALFGTCYIGMALPNFALIPPTF